jgi:hypothetical protein
MQQALDARETEQVGKTEENDEANISIGSQDAHD